MRSRSLTKIDKVKLPSVIDVTEDALIALTAALGVPRDVLNSNDEIAAAWANLPRQLQRISPAQRSELHLRMCVAVATGLFDSAINYAWNSAILELREKVRRFGLNVVSQINGGAFDEKGLIELKDADLLSLCLKLNLITEDGFFMLDQCRAVRNNFSSAHPTMGRIDDAEFLNFLSRCVRYALSDERNPKGVDTQALLKAVKAERFSDEQEEEWEKRLKETHDAQRELIVSTLHGLYCDPAPSQEARLNALDLCKRVKDNFSPAVTSELINRHSDYVAHGDSKRRKASETFFVELGLLKLLSEADQHTLVSNACRQLWSTRGLTTSTTNPPSQSAFPHSRSRLPFRKLRSVNSLRPSRVAPLETAMEFPGGRNSITTR